MTRRRRETVTIQRRKTQCKDVRLSHHASRRLTERNLDKDLVKDIAARALQILNQTSLKFKHEGHTLVAAKDTSGNVTVVTAWKD